MEIDEIHEQEEEDEEMDSFLTKAKEASGGEISRDRFLSTKTVDYE